MRGAGVRVCGVRVRCGVHVRSCACGWCGARVWCDVWVCGAGVRVKHTQKYYFVTQSASDYVTKKGSGTVYYESP